MAFIPPWVPPFFYLPAPPWLPVLRSVTFCKTTDTASEHTDSRPWLTFGFLYHMVETAWFRNQPFPILSVQIHSNSERITFPANSVTSYHLQTVRFDDPVPHGVAAIDVEFNLDEHLDSHAEDNADPLQPDIDPRQAKLIREFANTFPGQPLGGPGCMIVLMRSHTRALADIDVDRNCMQAVALREFNDAGMWPSDKEVERIE